MADTQVLQAVLTGANVRAEMARRKMRQADLAKLLGYSQPAVSARLSGAHPFDVNELRVIADAFGVSLCSLLEAPAAAAS